MRAAKTGARATVFGAYGFMGKYVVWLLAKGGTQCIIPFRGDDLEWRHLKVMGDYGMVTPVPFSPRDDDSIRRAIGQSDIVINLMGKDYQTAHYLPWLINSSFEFTNITLAEKVARIAVEQEVSTLVHVSALAADKHALSRWARTKALGEEAVRAIAPGATIVRPADVFGPDDRFLTLYGDLFHRFGRIPLVDGGAARVQPVFVQDVARAIHKIAESDDPDVALAQTYDLAGPDTYTHREVVEYVFETIQAIEPRVVNLRPAIADIVGNTLGLFPTTPLSQDKLQRWQTDNVLDSNAASKRLHDLGIAATSMEMPGFTWLHQFRPGSYFIDIRDQQRLKRAAQQAQQAQQI